MGEQLSRGDRRPARPIEDVLRENRVRVPQFISLLTSSSAEIIHLGQSGEDVRPETLDVEAAAPTDTSE